MKQLITLILLFAFFFSNAQSTIPVSHGAGVIVTSSSAAAPMSNLKDFNLCAPGNTGAYGGWIKMDLGINTTISSIRWWINMSPNGNVTSEIWEVSPDNVTWTLAANTSGPHADTEEKFLSFSTPFTNMRYIRVTQSGTPSWFAIYEMIVNEPYFKDNIYQYMQPKVLDSTGKVFSGNIALYPYTFICSKASTYQWKLNGTNIPGATSQSYTATGGGTYTCSVTYPSAGSCGFSLTSNPGPAGALVWLKADAGVYSDAGITPATNGQAIQQWNDQSGNGYNVSQITAANKPSFVAIASDGKPGLQFNGAQIMSTLTNVNWTATNVANFFVVCKSTNPNGILFETSPDDNTNNGSTVLIDNYTGAGGNGIAASVRGGNGGFRAFKNTAGFIPCTKIYQVTYDMTQVGSPIITVKLNNAPQTDNVGYTTAPSPAGGLLNYPLFIGARSGLTSPITGNISEIIAYKNALTTAEEATVYNYLSNKYFSGTGTTQFTAVPVSNVSANAILDDASWKHGYSTANNNQIIASVKDNCLNLGTISPSVYVDANASLNGGGYTLRRHYVINVASDPVGTKRVRLYYTNADFADLQTFVPSLTSPSQLAITKYDGLNEDGVYDPTGGTLAFIPAAQITTGTAFGQNYLEFNVAGFSEFWIHTGSVALPLRFLSFTAQKCNKNSVCLDWKTANEQNVSRFEIERSEDGRIFKSVGTKTANNQAANSYSSTDDLLNNTKVFYRIKQIDTDGKFSYSDVRTVLLSAKISIGIYPNPAINTVNISGWNNIKQMKLYDMSGRILKEWKTSVPEINIGHLLKGTYILKADLKSGEMLQEKIVKI